MADEEKIIDANKVLKDLSEHYEIPFFSISDDTKKTRRNLLAISISFLCLYELNIPLNDITISGARIDHIGNNKIFTIFGILIFFEFITFIMRVIDEYFSWRIGITASKSALIMSGFSNRKEAFSNITNSVIKIIDKLHGIDNNAIELIQKLNIYFNHLILYKLVSKIRFLFIEIGLPILAAIYAQYDVLHGLKVI